MKTMRIRQPASLDNLLPDEAEAPEPGPGEIKVRVRGGSLNFRDGLVVNGFFPVKDGLVPLSDGAGEVIAVGAGVREFQPGDCVVSTFHPKWLDGFMDRAELDNSPGGPADGFACEEATRPATHFTHAPRGWSPVEAATLTCAGVTAWRAVVADGQIKPGATIVIQGTGGVSLFALQFAKAAGATVIATSSSAEKLARLTELGSRSCHQLPRNREMGRGCSGADWRAWRRSHCRSRRPAYHRPVVHCRAHRCPYCDHRRNGRIRYRYDAFCHRSGQAAEYPGGNGRHPAGPDGHDQGHRSARHQAGDR